MSAIAGTSKGSGARGALNYNLEKEGASVIAGNLMGTTSRELAMEFGIVRAKRPNYKRCVRNTWLSISQEDRQKFETNPKLAGKLAKRYMEESVKKYAPANADGTPGECPWVAILHPRHDKKKDKRKNPLAASTDRLQPWLKQVDFDALRDEHGVQFTAVGVVDSSSDSVANIGFWAGDVLQGNKDIRFVIAQNKVRGEELSYSTSEARREYQKKLDLAEIEIPKLDEWVHQKLEVADLRIGAALEVSDPANPLTKFMTRSRLKKYQQAVFAEFEKIKARLLP